MSAVTLLGMFFLTFFLLHLFPGSPVENELRTMRAMSQQASVEFNVSPQLIAELKNHYGFDKSFSQRLWLWIGHLLRFDFGQSFAYQRPALKVIADVASPSVVIGASSLFLTLIVALPFAVVAVWLRRLRWLQFNTGILFLLLYVTPTIIVASVLFALVSEAGLWPLLPVGGLGSWKHYVLPILCLALPQIVLLTVILRDSLLKEVQKDYFIYIRARGVSELTGIFKHAFRNSLAPLLAQVSQFSLVIMTGTVVVEHIFRIPGLGQLLITSLQAHDYNVVLGLVVLSGLFLIVIRTLADLTFVWLDPRVNLSGDQR